MAWPDIHDIFGDYLAGISAISTLTGSRIYAGRNDPAAGYRPSDGECITFRVNGGTLDYSAKIVIPRMQVKCYGESEKQAHDLYLAMAGNIHDTHPSGESQVYRTRLLTPGQPILEERGDIFWKFTLSFWRIEFRNC